MLIDAPPWVPSSWRKFPTLHQPPYQQIGGYETVVRKIRGYPPLVFATEVERLRVLLGEAAAGQRFLLQGGDCAERFQDCNVAAIMSKLDILRRTAEILETGLGLPVVQVGRIAGQYAKPRSAAWETVDGAQIQTFLGDAVNAFTADAASRIPDPRRLLDSYHCSSLTINFIRALVAQHGRSGSVLGQSEFFTSHEGLLLAYEEALTHGARDGGPAYNLGAHMLWIGDRTRSLSGGHIEYFRGIANPIGVKLGPSTSVEDVVNLARILDPKKIPGRLTFITRLGAGNVHAILPPWIAGLAVARHPVLWSVDPMHGNLSRTSSGKKTRDFSTILAELSETICVHRAQGSWLGGVHFELTGDDVTECIGGSAGITEADLSRNYDTSCDPRLNSRQSLEMADLLASMLRI